MSKANLRPEDFNRMQFLGEVQLSPDGQHVYYDVSYIDQAKNIYRGEIWHVDLAHELAPNLAQTTSRRLTNGSGRDSIPRLSPDGKNLAFLSDRGEGGKKQIFCLDLTGPGEAKSVTTFQGGVNGFVWSPDNRYLVALVETPDDAAKAAAFALPETPEAKQTRETAEQEAKRIGGQPVKFTQAIMRADGRRTLIPTDAHVQLWLIDSTGENAARQLTTGSFGVMQPTFSPDGRYLVFVSTRDQQQSDFTSISDLWLIEPQGDLTLRKLTTSFGPANTPRWSPDGKQLAFVGHTNPKDGSGLEQPTVWVLDVDETSKAGEPRGVMPNFDYPVANLINTDLRTFGETPLGWSADGQKLYFMASYRGSTRVFEVAADGASEPVALTSAAQHLYAYSFAPQAGSFAFAAASPNNPGNVFVQSLSAGAEPQQITHLNEAWLAEVTLGVPEKLAVPTTDGTGSIEAWVIKPPNFDPTKKYPLVLEIHGGPHTAYGYSFNFEFQVLAGQGAVVLYPNQRGSIGYGYDWAKATYNDWGGRDYADVMATVDYVIEQGYIDTAQLGVTGGSYGGYMTNWIVTHTDRFKVALTQRCVSNLITLYTLSDIGLTFIESEFGGDIWSNPLVWERSPMAHANKARTPLLMLHSEMDFRCPIEQAEEFYFALKHVGCQVELVRTPNEDHNLSRNGSPDHRIGRLRRIANWFAENLG